MLNEYQLATAGIDSTFCVCSGPVAGFYFVQTFGSPVVPLRASALDRAGGHSLDDLPVEEKEHDERRDGDQQDVHEE